MIRSPSRPVAPEVSRTDARARAVARGPWPPILFRISLQIGKFLKFYQQFNLFLILGPIRARIVPKIGKNQIYFIQRHRAAVNRNGENQNRGRNQARTKVTIFCFWFRDFWNQKQNGSCYFEKWFHARGTKIRSHLKPPNPKFSRHVWTPITFSP